MTNDVYQVTKTIAVEGFAPLTVVFVPVPVHKVARHETEVANAAFREGEKHAKAKKLEGAAAREYAVEVAAEHEYLLKAGFIAERISGWDRVRNNQPVVVSVEEVLTLPWPVFVELRQVVLGYASGKDAEADEKKSA